MEFEELQKIWIAGNQEPVYAINEKALHNRILSKRKSILHIANVSELLSIVINLCVGIFIGINFYQGKGVFFFYLLAAWMILTSAYVLYHRYRRLRTQPKFDRSLREDLQHAVATATYQVRLSQIMRLNIVPIALLSFLGILERGRSVWFAVGILVFYALTYMLGGWEHNIYRNKKRELELLQAKLEKE